MSEKFFLTKKIEKRFRRYTDFEKVGGNIEFWYEFANQYDLIFHSPYRTVLIPCKLGNIESK